MGNSIEWIRIYTNIFENRKIKFILSVKNGEKFFIIWLRILTLAGKINDRGNVYVSKNIAYTPKTLGVELGESAKVISEALKLFESLEMIRVSEDSIVVEGWEEHQNVEGMERIREQTRNRVKKYREKQNVTQQSNVTETQCNVTVTQQNKKENKNKNIDRMEGIVNIYNTHTCEEENPSVLPSNQSYSEFLDVITFYQENIDPLMSSYMAECIVDDCREFGKENMLAAIQQAKNQNKKRYDYIRGAAKGKHNDAIYGPSEAYQARQKEKAKQEESYSSIVAKQAEELLGEWQGNGFEEEFLDGATG